MSLLSLALIATDPPEDSVSSFDQLREREARQELLFVANHKWELPLSRPHLRPVASSAPAVYIERTRSHEIHRQAEAIYYP